MGNAAAHKAGLASEARLRTPSRLKVCSDLFAHLASNKLRDLDLQQNFLCSRALAPMTTVPHFASLTHLNLAFGSFLPAKNLPTLKQIFASLQSLDLSSNQVDEAGARAIANATQLKSLRHLRLACNYLGAVGISAVVDAPQFASLTYLDLSYNSLSRAGAQALADATHMTTLQHLDLASNRLGNAAARIVVQATQFASLRPLSLRTNAIFGEGLIEGGMAIAMQLT